MPRFANVDGLYIVTEPIQQHHGPGKHVKYTSHEREHTHTSFHCVLSSRRGTNCVTLYMHHLCNLIFYPRIPNEIIVASDFTSWLDYTFFLQHFWSQTFNILFNGRTLFGLVYVYCPTHTRQWLAHPLFWIAPLKDHVLMRGSYTSETASPPHFD